VCTQLLIPYLRAATTASFNSRMPRGLVDAGCRVMCCPKNMAKTPTACAAPKLKKWLLTHRRWRVCRWFPRAGHFLSRAKPGDAAEELAQMVDKRLATEEKKTEWNAAPEALPDFIVGPIIS